MLEVGGECRAKIRGICWNLFKTSQISRYSLLFCMGRQYPFPTLEEKQWLILWKAPKRRSLEWKTWCMVKNGGKELYVLRTGGLNESLHTEYFPTGLLEPWYSNPPGRTLKETSLETLTSLRIHLWRFWRWLSCFPEDKAMPDHLTVRFVNKESCPHSKLPNNYWADSEQTSRNHQAVVKSMWPKKQRPKTRNKRAI